MAENTPRTGPFPRRQRAFLVSPDPGLADLFRRLWPARLMDLVVFDRGRGAIEVLFNEPPDLLVVDNRLPDMAGAELANLVKSENVYRQVAAVLCLDPADLDAPWDFAALEVDDLMLRPFVEAEVRLRVELTLCRAARSLDANPLTRLPGNASIIRRIQDGIDAGEDFALAYCDLDHFKSFNDKYGFSRGDEVLMMAARIIVNTVRGLGRAEAFVGHVGGDDFVFLVPAAAAEEACKRVIAAFDSIVPSFYDEDDRRRGAIVSTDRQGELRTFPLMAVSIAVVFGGKGRFSHYGEAASAAMSLKKKAKENPKSCYVLDRREK